MGRVWVTPLLLSECLARKACLLQHDHLCIALLVSVDMHAKRQDRASQVWEQKGREGGGQGAAQTQAQTPRQRRGSPHQHKRWTTYLFDGSQSLLLVGKGRRWRRF